MWKSSIAVSTPSDFGGRGGGVGVTLHEKYFTNPERVSADQDTIALRL